MATTLQPAISEIYPDGRVMADGVKENGKALMWKGTEQLV